MKKILALTGMALAGFSVGFIPGVVTADTSPDVQVTAAAVNTLRVQLKSERTEHKQFRTSVGAQLRNLRKQLGVTYTRNTVDEALTLASIVYGVPKYQLEFVARRESHFIPWIYNGQGSGACGLFQFMPGTYGGTPYAKAGFLCTNPYANALAAGWMVSRGGWGPWTYKGRKPF